MTKIFTNATEAHAALLEVFAFQPFLRVTARRHGLEDALRLVEDARFARFVRCVGAEPDGRVYNADYEQFRLLALCWMA